LDANPGAIEAHPAVLEAQLRVVEAHSGIVEVRLGVLEPQCWVRGDSWLMLALLILAQICLLHKCAIQRAKFTQYIFLQLLMFATKLVGLRINACFIYSSLSFFLSSEEKNMNSIKSIFTAHRTTNNQHKCSD
jgi:hypothetical protein